MNMHIGALQQQHENWKAARARLFKPAVVKTKPVEPVAPISKARPSWEMHEIEFDDHVRLYRKIIRDYMAELSVEMIAAQAEAAAELLPVHTKTPARDIIDGVLQHFPGITWADLKSQRRARCYALPRQIAIYELSIRRKDMSLPQIGRLFGGRDHSTAYHAIKKISGMVERGDLDYPFASA